MVDFNKMPCVYWSGKMKVEWLQRFILLHSIIYYKLDDSCITDNDFDIISKQYLKMSKNLNLNELRATHYYYCMDDFDGNTGFDIIERLNREDYERLLHIATYILYKNKAKRK